MITYRQALILICCACFVLLLNGCASKPKVKRPEIIFPFCGTHCEYAYITNQTNLDITYNF